MSPSKKTLAITTKLEAEMFLKSPTADLTAFSEGLGQAWGVAAAEPLIQYIAWAELAGVFRFLDKRGDATLEEISGNTTLNLPGADALTAVLLSLKILTLAEGHRYALSNLAREYVLRNSPYYVGHAFYMGFYKDVPSVYTHQYKSAEVNDDIDGPDESESHIMRRLLVQHSRNFAASVVAARTGRFDAVHSVVDMAGGSGVFAIPLALDHPGMRITLVDRPKCVAAIRKILARHGLAERVEVVGADMFNDEWPAPDCDGVLFGNVFHSFDDDACYRLARKSFELLSPNGKMWLHEVVFNESRDGPIVAALWNATMRMVGGRQRSAAELFGIANRAGFGSCTLWPTANSFSLIECSKDGSR